MTRHTAKSPGNKLAKDYFLFTSFKQLIHMKKENFIQFTGKKKSKTENVKYKLHKSQLLSKISQFHN